MSSSLVHGTSAPAGPARTHVIPRCRPRSAASRCSSRRKRPEPVQCSRTIGRSPRRHSTRSTLRCSAPGSGSRSTPRQTSQPLSWWPCAEWPPRSSSSRPRLRSSARRHGRPPGAAQLARGASTMSTSPTSETLPRLREPQGMASMLPWPKAPSAAAATAATMAKASARGIFCRKSSTYWRPRRCTRLRPSSSCRARTSSRLRQPAAYHCRATASPTPCTSVNSRSARVASSPCRELSRPRRPVTNSSRHFSRVFGPRPEIRSKSSGRCSASGQDRTSRAALTSCQLRQRSPRAL
mmetsp:Transcript_30265/g.96726  ORF Transcript_30265/g.96726 Transcript_30265/m.96726 type:complete len:295 (-) Transcript_30265:178-1062(-)